MNTRLIFWIGTIFLGAIVVATVWYFLSIPNVAPQTSNAPTTLPIGGSTSFTVPPSATSSQVAQTMALAAQDGSIVAAADFIHNGATITDAANAGRYLLAGNLGFCLSNPQQCQAAPSDNYMVYYNSTPQSFTIELTREPIGRARLDMEQFLFATLGLTEEQLCSLNYYVGVTIYVNSQYTGKNLGFSFCPGATVLPK